MNDDVMDKLYWMLREFFINEYETDRGGQFMLDVMQSVVNVFNSLWGT